MAISQNRSLRKPTGGRYKGAVLKKKHSQSAKNPTLPKIGKLSKIIERIRGGHKKYKLLHSDFASVSINGKVQKLKVIKVVENDSNKNFIRRNIVTKGAVLETEKGNVKVTNKPGSEGFINAKLI